LPIIRMVDAVEALPVFWDILPVVGRMPPDWAAFCRARGFVALAAEEAEELVGFAVAESQPQVLHVLSLEGSLAVCRLLLGRLVRAAGERDLSGRFPASRADLLALLEATGFTRQPGDDSREGPSCLYRWRRNECLDEV
jgi:hypothetical protein